MPYESDAQRKFMHARHPEIAKRWDAEERKPGYQNAGQAKKEAIRRRLSNMSSRRSSQATESAQGPKTVPEGFKNYGQFRASQVRQNTKKT